MKRALRSAAACSAAANAGSAAAPHAPAAAAATAAPGAAPMAAEAGLLPAPGLGACGGAGAGKGIRAAATPARRSATARLTAQRLHPKQAPRPCARVQPRLSHRSLACPGRGLFARGWSPLKERGCDLACQPADIQAKWRRGLRRSNAATGLTHQGQPGSMGRIVLGGVRPLGAACAA